MLSARRANHMKTRETLQKRLESLQLEYRGMLSMLLMMEKGTKLEDLRKIEREKLDPIRKQIQMAEVELKKLA
jgi:hypothetical protein